MTYRVTLRPDGSFPPPTAVDVEADAAEVNARGDLLLHGAWTPPRCIKGAEHALDCDMLSERPLLRAFAAGTWREVACVAVPENRESTP